MQNKTHSKLQVSFIIPAYNEQNNIGAVIKSINEGGLGYEYEIIVMDHASVDRTSEIAKSLSAKVHYIKGGTISTVRNMGVRHSTGNILVFLDADVTLTNDWFLNFPDVVKELSHNPDMITGSHCNAPENATWIERYWFNSYTDEKNSTNIGTGHMIVSRKLFNKVAGFNETLETGEDYAFCMSILSIGGKVINNPNLKVIHHDYPKNLFDFVRREAWHGKGDATSIKAILNSKVAIASVIFLVLHLSMIAIFLLEKVDDEYAILPVVGVVSLLFLSSWKKFKHCRLSVIFVNSIIFYFYYSGRILSLKNLFLQRKITN